MMQPIIYEKLKEYSKSDFYPFHMPGHKRRFDYEIPHMAKMDITEIDGFDNLHAASGIILQSMKELSKVYGTKQTFYSVNGSSAGNLAAIASVCHHKDGILVGRNCHKSVYHAIQLLNLVPYYIVPEYSEKYDIFYEISEKKLEQMLKEHTDIKAVVITSPTYEGAVMDIATIARICHHYGKVLIVDEAHGAHFPFSDDFPESAITKGADLVIQSVHKTLPCLTQTALLHLCSNRVKEETLQEKLSIFETSSPSYLFLATTEQAIAYVTNQKEELFSEYFRQLTELRRQLSTFSHIKTVDNVDNSVNFYDYDWSKVMLSTKNSNISGKELYDILRNRYHLQLEMAAETYVLAMTSVMDEREGFERLLQALKEIDATLKKAESKVDIIIDKDLPEQVCTPYEASLRSKEWIPYNQAKGRISGKMISLYPPGCPMVVPGEVVTEAVVSQIHRCKEMGLTLTGSEEDKISVLV